MGGARSDELKRRHRVAAAALALAGAMLAASASVFTLVLAGVALHHARSVARGQGLDRARAWSLFLGLSGMAGAALGAALAVRSDLASGAAWMAGLFLCSAALLVIVERALRPAA